MDEWGQTNILTVMTRYARCYFVDPRPKRAPDASSTQEVMGVGSGKVAMPLYTAAPSGAMKMPPKQKKLPATKDLDSFYASDDDGSESDKEDDDNVEVDCIEEEEDSEDADEGSFFAPSTPLTGTGGPIDPVKDMNDDHKLLRSALPLLSSRNSGVVLSVAAIMWYCGKRSEGAMRRVSEALVRLLRSYREVAWMALTAIIDMMKTSSAPFAPHLKRFFVTSTDAVFVRLLKLEALTLLVTEANVHVILKELEVYMKNGDKRFVTATIHAVGCIVEKVPMMAKRCVRGLLTMMSSQYGDVVAEAVIVTRVLLQKYPDCADAVKKVVKLIAKVEVPAARASLIWIVSEFSSELPRIAPEVLRITAREFFREATTVKMQVVNLAARMLLNPSK